MVITNKKLQHIEKSIKTAERVKKHGEVFTPSTTVQEMIGLIPDEVWADPTKNTLEPTCGNGNFIIAIINKKIKCGQTITQALSSTYGVDIMYDNIIEIYEKIFLGYLKTLFPDNQFECMKIMLHNIRLVKKSNDGTLGLNLSTVSKHFPGIDKTKCKDCIEEHAKACLTLFNEGNLPAKEDILCPLCNKGGQRC
jgi:hypothetical protein